MQFAKRSPFLGGAVYGVLSRLDAFRLAAMHFLRDTLAIGDALQGYEHETALGAWKEC